MPKNPDLHYDFFLLLGIFEASYHIMNGFQYFFQILWKSRREKTPPNNFSVILCVNKNIVVVIQEKKVAMSQLTMHKTRGLFFICINRILL